jgi:sialic acid synthase SpsE/sugar phosphate isomerase/epimerase
MIIEKNFTKYLVFSDDSISSALRKINENKSRICYVVRENGYLLGIVTDGDVRRWLTNSKEIDLTKPISQLMNTKFTYGNYSDSSKKINSLFSDKIISIPLIDDRNILVAIAFPKFNEFRFETKTISNDSPTFIIAEIGNNHNGDLNLAKKLVDLAVASGADCAKFQMRDMRSLYSDSYLNDTSSMDLGTQYTIDLLDRFQLKDEEMFEVFDYCRENGIIPLCTAWDKISLYKLEEYGISGYKISSADFINHDLIEAVVKTGKPVICSTGMMSEAEIINGISYLNHLTAQYILLHCNSTYPAPYSDINLNYIKRLSDLSKFPVGYSGHERDIYISIAAVALGAKVIEKHFTIDRSMEGNDHKVSLLPDEFKKMTEGIRQVELSLGSASQRVISQGELMNRETLSKSLVAKYNLNPGDVLTEDMIEVKGPGQGIAPYRLKEIIGRELQNKKNAGDCFFDSDISIGGVKPRKYSFNFDWGIPVRYHDFNYLKDLSNIKLIEIHLSYKDLEINYKDYINEKYKYKLVVHAPELFFGDHVVDLCSLDETYRKRSVYEIQRVIDLTNALASNFSTEKPCIVLNVGGFSKNGFLEKSKKEELYKLLEISLSELDFKNTEVIPQTMPPYPWHFGGQQYHNLFLDDEEIVDFCERNNIRICFDVSHTKLYCNLVNKSLTEYVKNVAPYIAHMHLADSKGVGGEGLQIGEGEIDWIEFWNSIKDNGVNASFIPEIWQGHKNHGEGSWLGLEKLEGSYLNVFGK